MARRGDRRGGAPQQKPWRRRLFPWGGLAIAVLVVAGLGYLSLVARGPTSDATLPDFILSGSAPVQEAYAYAVEHPEVLQYLPCYCGCIYHGHTNNEECFIDERLSDGTAVFDSHAST